MDRRRAGAQFEESYVARDIDQAVKGSYPTEFVANTTAGQTQILFTVPQSVWRVVTHCAVFPGDGSCACITVTREGVAYYIGLGNGLVAGQRWTATLFNPITLKPGDVLAGQAANAINLSRSTAAYIDVPIPGGGEPCFKPGRRG